MEMKNRIHPAFRWHGTGVLEKCVCEPLCLKGWQGGNRGKRPRKRRSPHTSPLPPHTCPPPPPNQPTHPPHRLKHRSGSPGSLLQVQPPLRNFLPLASCPGPAHSQKARLPSLFVLPKHVVLFAFHVLEVKVGSGHALVDVLDVVACGLKVGRGIVGSGGEDLGQTKTDETEMFVHSRWCAKVYVQNQTSPTSKILASKDKQQNITSNEFFPFNTTFTSPMSRMFKNTLKVCS